MTTNRQFALDLAELKLQEDSASTTQPATPAETPNGILAKIGPIPREALFLGMASDGLPVLLNLHDPHPGPVLIIGDASAGKTAFLQYVARSVIHTHNEQEIQFGVITSNPDEWGDVENTSHRIGIFDVNQTHAENFILSLAAWAHSNKNTKQSILFLVDNLESIAKMDLEAVQHFRWLLLRGPARRVWPFISVNAERYGQVLAWIEIFRTRVFGRIANARVAEALGGDKTSALDQLEAGRQFSLRENGNWLRFRLPSF